MSRIQQIAATFAFVVALGPAAFAASAATQSSSVIAASEGGSLPAVNVSAAMQYMDYTGVAPAPKAEGISVWSTASAMDYTGVAAAVDMAQLERAQVWNLAQVHEFEAQ